MRVRCHPVSAERYHVDPHGKASICKVGRDPQVSLIDEGVEGLSRLGGIADRLLLRQGAVAAAP